MPVMPQSGEEGGSIVGCLPPGGCGGVVRRERSGALSEDHFSSEDSSEPSFSSSSVTARLILPRASISRISTSSF